MSSIPLNLQALWKVILSRALNGVNKALIEREKKMKQYAPTDSGDYSIHFTIKQATLEWNQVVGSNKNNSEHAFGVEYGFRKTAVNWHKWPPRNSGTKIYNGIGAKVMQRVVTETAAETLSMIVKSINEW